MSKVDEGKALAELSAAEIDAVSGGQYVAIQPWAIGTSGALQKLIVQKLEILGNPFAAVAR